MEPNWEKRSIKLNGKGKIILKKNKMKDIATLKIEGNVGSYLRTTI